MTRTLTTILFLTISIFLAKGQDSNGYIFKDFTQGQVLLKNKQFARGKFNYDFVNHQMHFLNGNTDMIVENLPDIEMIIIGDTRFMPYEERFVEVLQGKECRLLVDRKVNTRERGKIGAMGTATHGSVQAIDVNARFQRVNGENNTDLTIYKDEIEYTYLIQIKGKWRPFRNQVTFLKLYPKSKQEELKESIKTNKTDFNEPQSVLNLINVITQDED